MIINKSDPNYDSTIEMKNSCCVVVVPGRSCRYALNLLARTMGLSNDKLFVALFFEYRTLFCSKSRRSTKWPLSTSCFPINCLKESVQQTRYRSEKCRRSHLHSWWGEGSLAVHVEAPSRKNSHSSKDHAQAQLSLPSTPWHQET